MDGARAIGRMVATRRFDHAALAVPIVRARPIGKRVVGPVLRAPLWRDVEIPVDAQELFAGDAPGQMPYPGIHGVSITLNYDTITEAQKIFDRLAAGGKVTMAMQPSYWAKSFGMLVDKFGTPWIVNGELLPM